MINRKNRFHGHNSLNHMYKQGKTVRGEFVSLKYCPSKRDDYRLAVIVSKKVSKLAVKRNRIRRRVYEIVRTIRKDNHQNRWQYDLAITVFDDSLVKTPHQDLQASIELLLKKAKVI